MSTNKEFLYLIMNTRKEPNAAKLIEKEHLDVLIVNSNEAVTEMQDIFLASGHFLNVPGLPSLHPEMLPLW